MKPNQKPHLEAQIWQLTCYVGILFIDRFLVRLLVFSIPGLLISLTWPEYGGHTVVIACSLASLWAIADLARGIEIDHKVKDTTLRENVLEWYHSRSSKQ